MIDDRWERIVVNYEMDRTPEGRVLDSVIFYTGSWWQRNRDCIWRQGM